MIFPLILFLLAQVDAPENTPQEMAFCEGPRSTQPERFCLADRRHERAERDLAAVLAVARRGALAQKRAIAGFSRANGGVTIDGDPVRALETAQQAWSRSYKADCIVLGLAVATGNGGTEGVTTNWECEADRIFERAHFLTAAHPKGRE